MAETQFFTAAFFAFVGWSAATTLAFFRSQQLVSGSSKALCWFVPVAGFFLLAALIYEGLLGPAGGFRSFALGLIGTVFWVLAIVYPTAQLLVGFLAKLADR